MDILQMITEVAMNPIVQKILLFVGGGTLYKLIDKTLKSGIVGLFKNDKIILDAIQVLDDEIDRLKNRYPESHAEIESRIIKLLDRAKDIIKE